MSQQYVPEENERQTLSESASDMHERIEAERLRQELEAYKSRYLNARADADNLRWKLAGSRVSYNAVITSRAWKLTAPMRVTADAAKAFFSLRFLKTPYHLLRHIFSVFRAEGPSCAMKECGRALRVCEQWQENQHGRYTGRALEGQRREHFPRQIRFSILVPLYNTSENYLREMISSVQAQTYSDWELCLADGSDEAHAYVGRVCTELAQKDKRIRYQRLERNGGISENTNACLRMATGDYIGLLDHDDYLCPAALYEVMKAICEKGADFIYTDEATFTTSVRKTVVTHFKSDFAPDSLCANNYICHFTVFSKTLSDRVGGFRPECDGAQDFDMVLRLTEQAKSIAHIPKVLYFWRSHEGSTAQDIDAKPYVTAGGRRAVEAHLKRTGMSGMVVDAAAPCIYRVLYSIQGNPRISILIPNSEHIEDLRNCLDSIYQKSSYRNFEIIVIENSSQSPEIFRFYRQAETKYKNLRVIVWEKEFNYAAINNFGAQYASGDYLLLLNNDTEVISPDWMQEMLMFAQRPDVGAVGAKLYYPDGTIQHAGVAIGMGGVAGHYYQNFDRFDMGYMGRLIYVQDVGGVTAACTMLPKRVWDEIGGLDEGYKVAFNDVDMCMRIRQRGYLIVWTPYAELYHYESKSRGSDDTPEKQARFAGEVLRFQKQWAAELAAGDPYYNSNLSLEHKDFRPKRPEEYL